MTPKSSKDLTRAEFADLNAEEKAGALNVLFAAGVAEGRLKDSHEGWQRQLDWYRQAVVLGGHAQVFADLNADGKAQLLRSLVDAGFAEGLLNDNHEGWQRKLDWYRQAVALGGQEQVFADLNAGGKEAVLNALNNAGFVESQLENNREGWQRQLDWYRQAVALGGQEQVFADLNAWGEEAVLKALHNAGIVESQLENNREGWQRQLDRHRQAVALGGQEQVFADLNAGGKEAVLNALSNAGIVESQLENNREGWQRQLDWCRQAVALGGHAQVFADLNAYGKAQVLRSLVNAGFAEGLLNDNHDGWQRKLDWCRQAVALGGQEQVFADLNAWGKEAVLKAMHNAGIVESQLENNREGWQRQLDWCRQAVALGGHAQVFADLNAAGKGTVLNALNNAGIVESQLENNREGWQRQLDWYSQTVALGGKAQVFAGLNADGKGQVLDVIHHSGLVLDRLEDNYEGWRRQIDWYRQAAALGGQAQVFADLSAEGQASVLSVLLNAGFKECQLENDRDGWHRQLDWCRQVVALGGQPHAFVGLNARGKTAVLNAVLSAGFVEGQLEDNRGGWQRQLDWYSQAAAFAVQAQVFADLNAEGRNAALGVLVNAGSSEVRLLSTREGWQKALDWYRQAVALGEIHWNETGTALQNWAGSIFETANALPSAGVSKRGWFSVWGVLCEHQWSADSNRRFNELPGLSVPGEALEGAELWLQRSRIWGVNRTVPEHAQTVMETARGRLAQLALMQRQDVLLSRCLHEKWPVRFEGMGHWVLAHLAVFAPHLLPSSAEADSDELELWQPDVLTIAEALQWKDLWSQETCRAPYYLAYLLPSPQVDLRRYDCTAEHQAELQGWFSALHAGDSKPMAEALQAAWLGLMDDRFTSLKRLCHWIERQGIDEADAWRRARGAVLTARCDGLLQEVLGQRWNQPSEDRAAYRSLENARLTEAAAATRGHTPLQAAMQHNLRFLANVSLNQMLSAGAALGKADEDRLWELLQLRRLGVALAVKPRLPEGWSPAKGLAWDSEAKRNIQAMQTHLLVRAQLHDEARQRGDHLTKADERNELLEPFATYAREWRRMGWDLVLPTTQQTAGCLRQGQALVQYHLSEDGSALHAMVLRPGTNSSPALSLHELGSGGIDVQAVNKAVQQWQQALAAWGAADAIRDGAAYFSALSLAMQVLSSQWQTWQEPSHALQVMMRWVHEQAPAGAVCVWPHAWSSLPWQALWALAFEQRAEPLRCVASVGAWVQTQTRAPRESATTNEPLEPVVLRSLDVMTDGGESEAHAIARTLRVEAQASNDLGEVIKALQAKGPVHLAMHGQFDALDPWRSALVVEQVEDEGLSVRGVRLHVRKVHKAPPQQDHADRAQVQSTAGPSAADEQDGPVTFEKAYLPAWALSQVEIQADITLGVCESLQEGQGEGQAAQLGAAGLGAMLMAAGARSVTGSLWACNSWAAAVFFDFWYQERLQHPAALALQKAQWRLRELDKEKFLKWVEETAPQAKGAFTSAERQCDLAKELGWANPFDHPSCWAAFALLGDAPALPQPKGSAAQAGEGWVDWCKSLWRSLFRA